jgi:hypothetical protein
MHQFQIALVTADKSPAVLKYNRKWRYSFLNGTPLIPTTYYAFPEQIQIKAGTWRTRVTVSPLDIYARHAITTLRADLIKEKPLGAELSCFMKRESAAGAEGPSRSTSTNHYVRARVFHISRLVP